MAELTALHEQTKTERDDLQQLKDARKKRMQERLEKIKQSRRKRPADDVGPSDVDNNNVEKEIEKQAHDFLASVLPK